jgi:hypothetical protein
MRVLVFLAAIGVADWSSALSQATMEAVDALAEGWLSTAEEVLSSIWQFETALTKLHKMQEKSTHIWGPDEVCVFDKDACRKHRVDHASAVHTHINVLVTNGELVPTIAKLLLFGLDKYFHCGCPCSLPKLPSSLREREHSPPARSRMPVCLARPRMSECLAAPSPRAVL